MGGYRMKGLSLKTYGDKKTINCFSDWVFSLKMFTIWIESHH